MENCIIDNHVSVKDQTSCKDISMDKVEDNNNSSTDVDNIVKLVDNSVKSHENCTEMGPGNRPPPHLTDRDLNATSEEVSSRRCSPKPRLGVKVPYRNLSSQIVTQDEIAQELLERSLRKFQYHDVPKKGDMLFAMKLTHRLANKITSCNEQVLFEKESALSDKLNSTPELVSDSSVSSTTEHSTNADLSAVDAKNKSTNDTIINIKTVGNSINSTEHRDISNKIFEKFATMNNNNNNNDMMNGDNTLISGRELRISNDKEASLTSVNTDKLRCTENEKLQNKSKRMKTEPKTVSDEHKISNGVICKKDVNDSDSITKQQLLKNRIALSPLIPIKRNSELQEKEMDNETLIAILEGTAEMSDGLTSSPEALNETLPKVPVVKRKYTFKKRPRLDPKLEKELALKQLEDFEKNKQKRGRSKDILKNLKKPKIEDLSNSKEDETNNDNNLIDDKLDQNKPGAQKNVIKRRKIVKPNFDSVPKRLPKKYQRFIKRQIKNSKLKSKNPNNISENQKKLPEVPEVKIAIDKFIKTYTNKRKFKPNKEPVIKSPDAKVTDPSKDDSKTKVGVDEEKCDSANSNPSSETVKKNVNKDNKISRKVVCDKDSKEKNSDVVIIDEIINTQIKEKKNSKMMREINRLLGDEGAINMIYSVEQKRVPGGQRQNSNLPSLRRKKKDLMLRTKLVKNAVLRLSMSPGQDRVGRRKSPDIKLKTDVKQAPSRKLSVDSTASNNSDGSAKVRKLPADASIIIRRHSTSSSSGDEDTGNKLIEVNGDVSADVKQSFLEFNSKHDGVEKTVVSKLTKSTNSNDELKTDKSISHTSKVRFQLPKTYKDNTAFAESSISSDKFNDFQELAICQYGSLIQIILSPTTSKMKNTFNIKMLQELIDILTHLEEDTTYSTILVTSTGHCFSQGIDLVSLIHSANDKRRKSAEEFLSVLKNFVKCLASHKKILIAGVHGAVVGLGVAILPFFDIVLASDKTTFYTPYAKLGQVPEAAASLTLPTVLPRGIAKEMLLGCRMLTASESLQFGLVNRILWPDKFSEELVQIAKDRATNSLQCVQATKYILNKRFCADLEETLELESKYLIEHWCSEECQNNFKTYLRDDNIFFDL